MTRWLREPLLHFAVLGAALFAAYGALAPATPDDRRIVVTAGQVAALEAEFRATRQRSPDPRERQAIIDNFVRDEVLYREGLALGLDRDDAVIRNRVKLRTEFMAEDTLSVEPTDADLAAYLAAHRAEFEIPGVVTFDQVYFDPGRRGDGLDRSVAAVRDALRRGQPAAGDRTMLAPRMTDATPAEVTAAFGDAFSTALAAVPVGTWEGPVPSSFGVHLVRVTRRGEPRLPSLADARDVVAREWARARAIEVKAEYYRELLKRYLVTIEPAVPAAASAIRP
jgi:hypothetical protein